MFVCLHVCLPFFFSTSLVSFSFSFLEFINGVCGLRWMCCLGIVDDYVECTNVVKSGTRVIVTTGAIKGAEVGVSNSARQVGVSLASCSEREEESSNSKICTHQGLISPSLTRSTDVSHLPPCHPSACNPSDPLTPWHPSVCFFVFHVFEVPARTAPPPVSLVHHTS